VFKYAHYFASLLDWAAYSTNPSQLELALSLQPLDIKLINVYADRAAEAAKFAEWSAKHPAEGYGYTKERREVAVRDGHRCGVVVYRPLQADSQGQKMRLPLLFVTHGGGWTHGTAITDEMWFLAALLGRLREKDLYVVAMSLKYRLAPEWTYPGFTDDC